MDILNEIIILFIILVIVLILDGIIIGILNYTWNNTIKNIQGESLTVRNKIFPVIAYILIILGIRIFVYPYFVLGNIQTGIIMGLIWGIITYGIFDFTNLSLFKNYSTGLAIFDTIWGGVLAALTGIITFYIVKRLKLSHF